MIIDKDIQLLPMLTHTQADGSNIGGVAPVSYGMKIVPGKRQRLLLWTQGNTGKPTDYPAWMAYPAAPRPILPNTGNVSLTAKYSVGGNLAGLNVVETDLLLVTAGADGQKHLYNGSGQWHQQSGFQIVDANGKWFDTGFNPGPLVANVPRSVIWTYGFDTVAHTLAVKSITCNGSLFTIQTPLWISAMLSNWLIGAYAQIQAGSMPNGLPWSLNVGMDLIWGFTYFTP